MTRFWLFALAACFVPLAMLASAPSEVVNKADCPVGWYWDVAANQCVNAPNPVLGPVGPAGAGGLDPVAGPVGPAGVGGLDAAAGSVGPVGVGGLSPVAGPIGPVGIGGVGPVVGPIGVFETGPR